MLLDGREGWNNFICSPWPLTTHQLENLTECTSCITYVPICKQSIKYLQWLKLCLTLYFSPSLSLFLKTIWLQWCVVWHSAHPAALSLVCPLVINKNLYVYTCIHTVATTPSKIKTSVCRARGRWEHSICKVEGHLFQFFSLNQRIHYYLWCVSPPSHGICQCVATIRIRNYTPLLSVTTKLQHPLFQSRATPRVGPHNSALALKSVGGIGKYPPTSFLGKDDPAHCSC